jgi:hypothetical protein
MTQEQQCESVKQSWKDLSFISSSQQKMARTMGKTIECFYFLFNTKKDKKIRLNVDVAFCKRVAKLIMLNFLLSNFIILPSGFQI